VFIRVHRPTYRYLRWCSSGYTGRRTVNSTGVHQGTQADVPLPPLVFIRVHRPTYRYLRWCSSGYTGRRTYKGGVNFRPQPAAVFKIISIFPHEINSWLSSQPKGISVLVRGCYSCLHPVNRNNSYAAAKPHVVSLNGTTLFSPLSTYMFSQSVSITAFLTNPCSYLLRSAYCI